MMKAVTCVSHLKSDMICVLSYKLVHPLRIERANTRNAILQKYNYIETIVIMHCSAIYHMYFHVCSSSICIINVSSYSASCAIVAILRPYT